MKLGSFRTSIFVDDPQTGERREIKIKVKRFSVDEGTKFARDYNRSANPASLSMICRRDSEDEQATKIVPAVIRGDRVIEPEREEFVIGNDEIAKRRLAEMDAETRARYDRLDAEEEKFSNDFIVDTLTNYVRVVPGQNITSVDDFENEDAPVEEVKTGRDLARLFGGHPTVVRDLLRAVHLENSQDEQAKKVLRQLFGFAPFSVERETVAVGQRPEQTADAASKPVSVVTVDAGQNTTAPLSGSEATD
jgi:hypothetical protein